MAAAKPQWLRGIIKEVPSADTVVIVGLKPADNGIPAEKRITLSSLQAPRLGRRDGSTQDEPFAWAAREFTRQKAIGQPCVFRVDYTLEQAPGREFGSVYIHEKQNLAELIVENGWAKVRQGGGQQAPRYEELLKLEEKAKGASVGLWTTDGAASAASVRPPQDPDFNAAALVEKHGKGKPLPAVVEQVVTGSLIRVTLPEEEYAQTTVLVCGVQAPSMGRRVPNATAAGVPAAAAGGAPVEGFAPAAPAAPVSGFAAALGVGAVATGDTPPERMGPQSKWFTEQRVLNRDVRVVLQGVDRNGGLFGEVKFTAGDSTEVQDLGQTLVQKGLAKIVDWGVNLMTTGGFTLRELERKAKQEKLGIWEGYVAPASAGTQRSDKLSGTIVEVVSGDCVVVRDASGKEQRLNLSSIRAPRIGRRGDVPEPWALEAKEFLRSRYIGKNVDVSVEYSRKDTGPGGVAMEGALERTFATILHKEDNLALSLVAAGLAGTVRHRTDDARSAHYVALVEAEEAAKTARKGLHGAKPPPAPRINDLSVADPGNKSNNASRARAMLTSLQRRPKHTGICEFVITGNRLRILLPKEQVVIAFSPSGVKAPQRGGPGGYGGAPIKAEPFGEESVQFMRSLVMQREVELEIETVDKGGTFLGTIRRVTPRGVVNVGVEILEAGLAKLHPQFSPERTREGHLLVAAESKAKAARLKVWQDYDGTEEEQENANGAANGAAGVLAERKELSVTVTEVRDGDLFFIQDANEPRVSWLAEQIARLAVAEDAAAPPALKEGSMCLAQYSADDQWYRALVDKVVKDGSKELYDVTFVDFGNQERVDKEHTLPVDTQVAAVQCLATPCQLAFLKVPGPDDDYGLDATHFLCDKLGGGSTLTAYVERQEGMATKGKNAVLPKNKYHVSLFFEKGGKSVNEELVAEGLARVQVPNGPVSPAVKELVDKLLAEQDAAKKKHLHLWRYGDVGDDDEDADIAPRRRQNAWGRK